MPTIKEVAKTAGVSVATVSRVLNNNGYVGEDTREKVSQAITELNYKPNAVARSLYKKQSRTIGLIVPDITNPFFPELARAVEDVMNRKGYTVILGNSDEKAEEEKAYLTMMEQKYVDGAILATNTMDNEQVHAFNKPVVAIDRAIDSTVPTVFSDNLSSSREAVRHLKDLGCQVIAHVRGPEHVNNANIRCQGYIDVVGETNWFHNGYIVNGNYSSQEAYQSALTLLKDHPEIDGIFAGNDLMAIGVLKAARDLNIVVPDQLAVIGFDGISLCETTFPELSTMAQPIYQLGETAAEMLIDLIEQKQLTKPYRKYSAQLIQRQSTNKSLIMSAHDDQS
ncbi:LacI family DNA-binding transcriptional regulator [Tuberibacillus sp. Marseille-P3662]|uniref:LacI family DNA-binding transcriptional regulator n=1 Tax=Tuberibacillus sp. Marseille-P3662 TaxID=1965358 RepID=UPI000A1CA5FE|nr:LacI family DNA-binding transcriptional regulator [Tuberibacillus sp. Marseille-P3662]